MLRFECDYLEGCLPEILDCLQETNLLQTPGYGRDDICEQARNTIRRMCNAPDADVHFLVGGTQTNATVISSILRQYQGVVCAATGHINVHETGTIEHGGHKVLALRCPDSDGKINAEAVQECLQEHFENGGREHCVQPGMLYISMSTELGTIYSRQELLSLKNVCSRWGIPMFVDGARLGYALACWECDVTLSDLAAIADVFYIGGTKQGALFGEAVVICNDALKKDFRYCIKQGGGMLAKGRLLGLQFQTLLQGEHFEDTLYYRSAARADALAGKIKDALEAAGCSFLVNSPTNQLFPIFTVSQYEKLSEQFGMDFWCKVDCEHVAVRICTSWATTPRQADALIGALKAM